MADAAPSLDFVRIRNSGDIFEKYPSGRNQANGFPHLVPELPVLPGDSGAAAGNGVIGAGEASNDSSHAATIEFAWDCSHVRPDRRIIDGTFRNTRRQDAGGSDFVLHVQEAPSAWQSESDGEVEASGAAEKRDVGM